MSAGQSKSAEGFVISEAVTALSLTAIPMTAHAKGQGVGAAIGLGILGDAISGATVVSPAPWADSAADSGKLRFRPRKLPRRCRKSHCNQPLEPILAVPADSGNRAPFSTVGSGPAVELSPCPDLAKFGIS
jgi:hypothetical protein